MFAQTMHVLAVKDLAQSLKFYREVFGLADIHIEPRIAILGSGAFRVFLGECDGIIDPHDLGDHRSVGRVTVADVDAFHARVVARSGTVAAPVSQPWGCREFHVETPDGHRFTFQQELS